MAPTTWSTWADAPNEESGSAILDSVNNDGTSITWIEANWMFLAWAGALFGLGILVARINQRDAFWYGWLALVMYLFHQSEEHAYDFRGWRYAFVPHLNAGIGKTLFSSLCTDGQAACPVDPKVGLYINTIMIWVGFAGCMLAAHVYPERFLLAGSLCWGTAVVNGLGGHVLPAVVGLVTHSRELVQALVFVPALRAVLPALLSQIYNPGLVQSLVMVPLGIVIIRASGKPWLCVANGLGAHVIGLGVGINVMYRAHLPEAPATIFFNLLGGLVFPLSISWYLRPHSADTYKELLSV